MARGEVDFRDIMVVVNGELSVLLFGLEKVCGFVLNCCLSHSGATLFNPDAYYNDLV